MAKKILYKVTAYHCPRCGSPTEPTKKYCDYCERDLAIRSKNHGNNKIRLLIDCGNYVFFDNIINFENTSTPQTIDCTTLDDSYCRTITGINYNTFSVTMPSSARTAELFRLDYKGIHRIRFEHLGTDIGFEQECYISNALSEMTSADIVLNKIEFEGISETVIGKAIPQDVLAELRCPNCGAPVNSRYGACPYCSGWVECEW